MENPSFEAWVHMPSSMWMEAYHESSVLRWENNPSEQVIWKKGKECVGALEQFIGLADSSANGVLLFAKEWGVLELCEHGIPFTHEITNGFSNLFYGSGSSGTFIESRCDATGFEPVEAWRHHSKILSSVLSIAGHLHQDKPGKPEDWLVVEPWHDPHIQYWRDEALPPNESNDGYYSVVGAQKNHLTRIVQFLLNQSGAMPRFEWPADNVPYVGIVPIGLAAVLAVQAAFAVCKTTSIVNCTACGKLYVPKRKPQSGRGKYCSDCAPRGPARDYARRKAMKEAGYSRSFRVIDEMRSYKGGGLTTAANRWSERLKRRP